MTTYQVGNNTDMKTPLVTTSLRKARRAWNQIKPGPNAGNLYHARFDRRCACGEWVSMVDGAAEVGAAHCDKDS